VRKDRKGRVRCRRNIGVARPRPTRKLEDAGGGAAAEDATMSPWFELFSCEVFIC
jgi:hypothetical protein